MAVLGLGTDIVEIERIEKVFMRSGDTFTRRILTDAEYSDFSNRTFSSLTARRQQQQARFLAKRFAAKEAAAKALGTGIALGVTFQDFEISNDQHGRPLLTLTNQAAIVAQSLQINRTHITISDERCYAVATVILES